MGAAARARYEKAFDAVWRWRRGEGLQVPSSGKELEALLLDFMDVLYEKGAPAHEAELAVAATKDQLPHLTAGYTFASAHPARGSGRSD